MNIDRDRVPKDLDDAAAIVCEGLDEHERRTFRSAVAEHHGLGRWLRNHWSLWDKETHLVQWFRSVWRVGHADDISGLILEAAFARVRGERYDPQPDVARIHRHWRAIGLNEFGE